MKITIEGDDYLVSFSVADNDENGQNCYGIACVISQALRAANIARPEYVAAAMLYDVLIETGTIWHEKDIDDSCDELFNAAIKYTDAIDAYDKRVFGK